MAETELVSEKPTMMDSVQNSSHGYCNTSMAQTFTRTVHILTKCNTFIFTVSQQEATNFLKQYIYFTWE
jgi:hypothetical protein